MTRNEFLDRLREALGNDCGLPKLLTNIESQREDLGTHGK